MYTCIGLCYNRHMETQQKTRLSVTAAAKAVGVARSTIYRAIKTGLLSRSPDGTIDTAELHRVYPIRSASADATQSTTEALQHVAVNATHEARLEQRVADLERERNIMQQRLADERAEKLRLLSVVESQRQLLTAGQSSRLGLWQQIGEWFSKATQPPPDSPK